MVIVSKDITDPEASPFIVGDHVIANTDGSISISLDTAGTTFAGQEPNAYGVRHDGTAPPGAYQKFTRQGPLLISQTRPQDPVFVYTIAEGKAY